MKILLTLLFIFSCLLSIANPSIFISLDSISKTSQTNRTFRYSDVVFQKNQSTLITIPDIFTFWGCSFKEGMDISRVSFNGIIFKDDTFYKKTIVNDITFSGDAGFADCIFYDVVNITSCKFNYNNHFARSIFNSSAKFGGSIFIGYCSFSNVTFNRRVTFGCTFLNKVKFNNLKITPNTEFDFSNTIFPDTVDFSNNPIIYNQINLLNLRFDEAIRFDTLAKQSFKRKPIIINLYNSDISKFHLDYTHFKLSLAHPETGKELSIDEATSQYEALLKNFMDNGQMESHKNLDIEYQDYIRAKKGLISQFGGIVKKKWNMYGHEKGRIFLHTFIFLVFFSIITYFFFDTLTQRVYKMDNIPDMTILKSGLNWYQKIWYSFVYTSVLFFLLSLKVDKIQFHRWLPVLYIVLVYSVGIICIGYIADFILNP